MLERGSPFLKELRCLPACREVLSLPSTVKCRMRCSGREWKRCFRKERGKKTVSSISASNAAVFLLLLGPLSCRFHWELPNDAVSVHFWIQYLPVAFDS